MLLRTRIDGTSEQIDLARRHLRVQSTNLYNRRYLNLLKNARTALRGGCLSHRIQKGAWSHARFNQATHVLRVGMCIRFVFSPPSLIFPTPRWSNKSPPRGLIKSYFEISQEIIVNKPTDNHYVLRLSTIVHEAADYS